MLTAPSTLAQRLLPQTGVLARPLVRSLVLMVAGSLFMALCAQVSFFLPTTPVPITLQTLGVMLIGALFGARLGALTMLLYLVEGALGMPFFSGGRGGFAHLMGPTGGYLLSYPIAAFVVGLLAERGWDRSLRTSVVAMVLGSVVVYAIGFSWLSMYRGMLPNVTLFQAAVLPFLPGDAIKIVVAALALPGGWALFGRNR